MMRLLQWWRSLFAWREFRDNGVWVYFENELTGQRRAERRYTRIFQPLDLNWLKCGKGTPPYIIIDDSRPWK